jgi:hypothetical protein
MANLRPEIESLAAEIGENVYIDVAKWNLYLNDAHLHTTVAEKAFSLIEDKALSEENVTKILKEIKVSLGGGKMEVPLADLLPMKCQVSLMDILEKFQDEH